MVATSSLSEHALSINKRKIFSSEELSSFDSSRIPKHAAIVMDGNRRWAKKRGLPITMGHWKGAEALKKIIRAADEIGIEILTVFGFSTENWNRSQIEINALMRILRTYLYSQKKTLIEEGVRLSVIGDISKFPCFVQEALLETISATKDGNQFDLILALNYGGRNDIYRAMKAIIEDCCSKKISREQLSEQLIAQYLDTAPWGDPDLIIRTGGENRLSNFLLWQISYSEVMIVDALWPDFNEKDFFQVILEYQKRERRWGK